MVRRLAEPEAEGEQALNRAARRHGPEYLTTKEVAQRYRTSVHTIHYWRQINYIPGGVRRGRQTLFNAAVLDRWDAEQTGGEAA